MSNSVQVDLVSVKRKKMFLLVGIMAGILGISLVAVWVSKSNNKQGFMPAESKKLASTNIASPGEQIRPEDVWRAMSEAQIKNLESKDKERSEQIKQILEELERTKKEAKKQGKDRSDTDKNARAPDAHLPPLPPQPPSRSTPVPANQVAVGPQRHNPYAPMPGKGLNGQPVQNSGPSTGIMTVNFGEAQTSAAKGFAKTASATDKKKVRRTVDHYIPSGSFTAAILLGGIDAPTGGQAQHNPQPIVAQLVNTAILPNKYRYDIRTCHVVGAGYGDISSERAYVRLESLACVLRDGTVVDTKVKGFMADETGKAGMRGRVVTKTGQVLANALIAGIASGIGKAFQQTAQIQSISPLGSTTSIDKDKVAQAAAGSGLSTSMDKLADYYIKLADQLFPVIEIDSGRKIDVVFTEGVDLGKFDAQQSAEAAPSSNVVPRANITNRPALKNAAQQSSEGS